MNRNDKVAITYGLLVDTADAIRAKKGTSSLIDPSDFPSEVESISGATIQASKTATENGIVLPDNGYDALAQVIVNVSGGDSSKFSNGSITLASEPTSPITIEHDLGVTPNCIVFITSSKIGGSTGYLKAGWWFNNFLDYDILNKIALTTAYNNDFRGGSENSNTVQNVNANSFDLVYSNLISGCTFYWFALYIDTTQ